MRIGRTILCSMLALLWLALPVHCQLERVSAAAILACDSGSSSDCAPSPRNECAEDFCFSLESGQYFPARPFDSDETPAPFTAMLPAPELEAAPNISPPLLRRFFSEPSTVHTWHFAQRAALPVRAPARNS